MNPVFFGIMLFTFLSHSTSFASNTFNLKTTNGQAACSRALVADADADYVTNVHVYRAEHEKVSDSVQQARDTFLNLVRDGSQAEAPAIIASIGEGFGRDVKYFREQGLRAIGTDGSTAMVEESWKYLGTKEDFKKLVAQDFSLKALGLGENQKLSGIWAMASLHHVPVHELVGVFKAMRDSLASGGIIYASFVMGVGTVGTAEVAINRFWNRIDAQTLVAIAQKIEGLEIIDNSGRVENDYFAQVPSKGFHFYHLWLRRR